METAKRTLICAGLLVVATASSPTPALAQRLENPAISAPGPNDGKRPTGFIVQSDMPNVDGDSVALVYRGKGYYLQSGPSSIVFNPKMVARGSFVLSSTMFSGPTGATIPDGFGVFIGGKNMNTPAAEYTEFLVRNDGRYAVIQHIGPRRILLRNWTVLAGITQHNGRRDQTVRNSFRVVVDGTSVQLVVNRTLATSFLRTVVKPDGIFGIRIGQRQLVQVETLELERPAK